MYGAKIRVEILDVPMIECNKESLKGFFECRSLTFSS